MRLLIHIGPAKTGSTFIQQAFSQNSAKLVDQGVFYPTTNCREMYTGGFNSNNIAIDLIKGHVDKSIDAVDAIAQQARSAGCHSMVISAEGFAPALLSDRRPNDRFLKELSERFDVELVFFYRNFVDTVNSHFSQKIKTYDGWRNAHQVYAVARKQYFKRRDGILKIAGENGNVGISLVLFSPKSGPFNDICRLLGVDQSGLDFPEKPANARLHPATIALGYLAGEQAVPFKPRQLNALEKHLRARPYRDYKLTIVPAGDLQAINEEQRQDIALLSEAPNVELVGSLPEWWEDTLKAQKNCIQFDAYLNRISRLKAAPSPFNLVAGPADKAAQA
jgi:hypothetical protein